MSTELKNIRVRKVEENEILGPMSEAELNVLADSAYLSPGDEISYDLGDWKKAVAVKSLGMHWRILTDDGMEYGPTTIGTVREFFAAGEIDRETRLVHTETNEQSNPLLLLGEEALHQLETLESKNKEENFGQDFEESVEIAKDIRIRMLEVEYAALKKEFEDLSHRYRRTAEELIAAKKQ